jgi:hypothetical protein
MLKLCSYVQGGAWILIPKGINIARVHLVVKFGYVCCLINIMANTLGDYVEYLIMYKKNVKSAKH